MLKQVDLYASITLSRVDAYSCGLRAFGGQLRPSSQLQAYIAGFDPINYEPSQSRVVSSRQLYELRL